MIRACPDPVILSTSSWAEAITSERSVSFLANVLGLSPKLQRLDFTPDREPISPALWDAIVRHPSLRQLAAPSMFSALAYTSHPQLRALSRTRSQPLVFPSLTWPTGVSEEGSRARSGLCQLVTDCDAQVERINVNVSALTTFEPLPRLGRPGVPSRIIIALEPRNEPRSEVFDNPQSFARLLVNYPDLVDLTISGAAPPVDGLAGPQGLLGQASSTFFGILKAMDLDRISLGFEGSGTCQRGALERLEVRTPHGRLNDEGYTGLDPRFFPELAAAYPGLRSLSILGHIVSSSPSGQAVAPLLRK